MKNFSTVWKYYSREDVQQALLEIAKNREIVGVYANSNFDKRPNVLVYPEDIVQMVKKGVVSFHGSVERWSNPMTLQSGMLKQEMDNLRIGWDLIIDPDCPDFEISKLTVKIIIEALEDHGIKNYSLKYTGGKSFHIGLPFESFPGKVNNKKTETLYPELPKSIIEYLKDYVREQLKEEILALDNPLAIAERVGKSITDITDENGLNPFKIVEIDSMITSPRHMFRLPYSLHEKSLLVSVPIEISQLDDLKKRDGNPWKVKVKTKFLTFKPELKEAGGLVIESLDWTEKHRVEEERIPYTGPGRKIKTIPNKYFPPCTQNILNGLSDGRKRSLFILVNFLRNMGWDWNKIEDELKKWNEKNKPPLPKNYINTHLRWHKRQRKNVLPPNCDKKNFYINISVCSPDNICKAGTEKITIKNPVNYVFRRMKRK